MSTFEQEAGFRIAGSLVRKYVPISGKVVFLTIDVYDSNKGRSKKIEMRGFDRGVIDDVQDLRDGALLEVTGTIDTEKLTNKARNEVKIDGREKWVVSLTVRSVKAQGASRAPADRKEEREPGDDGDHAPTDKPEDLIY